MVKFIEIESKIMVYKGWRVGKIGSSCLMGTEFQLGMMKKLWRQMVVMIAQNVDVISINLKCQKTIMVPNKCAINICKTKDVNLGTLLS